MKKCITLLFVVAVIFSACGNAETSEKSDNTTTASTTAEVKSSTGQISTTIPFSTDSSVNAENSETLQADDTQPTAETSQLNNSQLTDVECKIKGFTPLCQYPDLPTGCEVTSLTMVLNFYGINCDKCEIADNYLDKGEVGKVNFWEAFEGDPRDENSFGCYSPVIVNAANKVLNAYGSPLKAVDISGKELSELFTYVDKNTPVIVWGTQNCEPGYYSITWNVNGEDLSWFRPEHCMVLVGYDNQSVSVADPLYGDIRPYDKATFESRYNSLFRQAIIIQ